MDTYFNILFALVLVGLGACLLMTVYFALRALDRYSAYQRLDNPDQKVGFWLLANVVFLALPPAKDPELMALRDEFNHYQGRMRKAILWGILGSMGGMGIMFLLLYEQETGGGR
jgi:hypothetical protein